MIRQTMLAAIWAVGTFALILAMGLPATSDAVDDTNAPGLVATILTPRLVVNGVELTVTPDSPTTQASQASAGDSQNLAFTVRAKNETAAPVSGQFKIRLIFTAPSRAQDRTLPMPIQFWADSANFNLHAGEAKTFTFSPPSPLLPGRQFTLVLNSSDQEAPMLSMVKTENGTVAQNP